MDSAEQPDPFSFSNNFWGKDEVGVHVLLGHINNTKHTADEVTAFYKERAAIEDDYSRRLLALSRKSLGTHEVGTLKSALDTIRSNTELLGKSHASTSQQFRSELEEPLYSFSGDLRSRQRTLRVFMEKLTKAKQAQQSMVDRSREKFETDCCKIKGYLAQQNLLQGKELERNNHKLDKTHMSIEASRRDYQVALRSLAETMDCWTKEWKITCDKLQDIEEERVNFLKSNLWAYTNLVSSVCVSDDEGCEHIRLSLEKCNVNKDIETFVRERSTGAEIMNPPEYINYMNGGNGSEVSQTYKIARFARVSANDVDHEYFDSSTSMNQSMMRTSVSLANDKNQRAELNSSYSSNPEKIAVVPILSHPQETFHDPRSPSHLHQNIISREGSMYSGTSMSSQSDINITQASDHYDTIYAKQPNSRQPIYGANEKPSHEKDFMRPSNRELARDSGLNTLTPVSTNEEPTTRRTWASPFRRRSKKDFEKGWNSTKSSTLNVRSEAPTARFNDSTHPVENTSPVRSSYRSPFANRSEAARTSSTRGEHSAMMPLGDDMFDVGGVSKFSSESRKPISPVKSLGRDDPLVMALEKLQVTPLGSPSKGNPTQERHHTTRQNPPLSNANVTALGFNNSQNYHGGKSGLGKSSNSALIPPQPAFTASEMKSTSERCSDQQRDMYNNSPHCSPQHNRSRSNAGDSFSVRPSDLVPASPRLSNGSIQQKPHPNTMYEIESQRQKPDRYRHGGNETDRLSNNQNGTQRISDYRGQHHHHHSSPVGYPNGETKNSMSPNPSMNRGSPNTQPYQQHNYNRRSASPNPQSQRPDVFKQRSASPNPEFAPPQPQYVHRQESQQSIHSRSASPMDFQSARLASPQSFQQQQHNNYDRAASARGNYCGGGRNSQLYDLEPPGSNGNQFQGDEGSRPRSKSALNLRGGSGHGGSGSGGHGGGGLPAVTKDGRTVLRYCRANYDYRAAIPEEVSFRAGDILLIVRMLEDGWWESEVLTSGRMGLAPSNFLKTM